MAPLVPSPTKPAHTTSRIVRAAPPAAGATTRRRLIASSVTAGPAALLALGAAGCAPGGQSTPPPAARGKVTLMRQGASPADQERYQPLVDRFNARGSAVTIDLIEGDDTGGAASQQAKLITLAAGGSAPDIFWTHASIAPNLIKLGLVAEITPYVRRDREFKLDSLFEAPTKNDELDGKLHGLPREATTVIMVINKELFAKNGVPLPTTTWTWDDYLRAAQALTRGAEGDKTWGASGWTASGSAVYYPWIKVWQEGGDVVDKTRTRFTLHQSPAVEQMQWIADLVTRHRVQPTAAEFPGRNLQEAWEAGRLGMVVQFSVYNSFNKAAFDWDIQHVPRGRSRATRTASAGHSITRDSRAQDAAWEALKFLASKTAYEHWARLGLNLPAHKEVANGALVVNPSAPPRSAKVALDAFEYARPEPASGDWTAVRSEISKAMSEVYAGRADARALSQKTSYLCGT